MNLKKLIKLCGATIYRILIGEYGVIVERHREIRKVYNAFGKEFFDKIKDYDKVKEIYDEMIELDKKIKELEEQKQKGFNRLKADEKLELLKELIALYEAAMTFIQIAIFYYYFELLEQKFDTEEKELFKEKIQKVEEIRNQMELVEFKGERYHHLLMEGVLYLTEVWLRFTQKWVDEVKYLHSVSGIETEKMRRKLILMRKGKL